MHQPVVKGCDIMYRVETETIIFLPYHIDHNRKNEKCPNAYDFIPVAGFRTIFGVKRITTNKYKSIYDMFFVYAWRYTYNCNNI